MKVFLIAAVTADGFIAKNSDHLVSWTSKEDKDFFSEKTKEAGVVVMGLNTYKTIGRPLGNRLNIVYSREEKELSGVEVTEEEPAKLIEKLTERGYQEVAICGGSTIYTMFMETGLIDTMYLTIEPILFGSGMNLFNKELDMKLQLESMRKLNKQSILLEYRVLHD